ncbi:hypothetical protein KI387_017521 [Taxus chinensis]|uniref:Protein kinase domain-containing protein n=1 Tax=Taxus chinensis TaxID=29808 RepID=A0AA38LJ44_TAXCH|nr:hypothetical protein KI387_017521 [Taxus chinensis]
MKTNGLAKGVLILTVIWWRYRLLVNAEAEANAGCPLDLGSLNFREATSVCSGENRDRGKDRCCRYVHALVGVSLALYANATSQIGVSSISADACNTAILNSLQLSQNGLSSNPAAFCGLGTKISVDPVCKDYKTIQDMERIPEFSGVQMSCTRPVSSLGECRICLNASVMFLHHLLGAVKNLSLSICRDATFVAIASNGNLEFAVDKASCFFGLQGLGHLPVLTRKAKPFFQFLSPAMSPVPSNPSSSVNSDISFVKDASSTHWMLIVGVGIGVAGAILTLFLLMIILIQRKIKELESLGTRDIFHWKRTLIPNTWMQLQEGRKAGQLSMFRRFSYKEIRIATDNFSTIVGKGSSGSVYRAQFQDSSLAAVKRMNGDSGQSEDEFHKKMELLGRLHHRHLVTLRGFCTGRQERFLVYEYMKNGSLKEHLLGPSNVSLNWMTRIHIAVDVAAALEYLHVYCDPHLCHGDVKPANILLDKHFVAKLADCGRARASPNDGNNAQNANSDIRGTPGYMDPEYVITQQLTLKSDVYSYGVLLLVLITGRHAVHKKMNLVEWAQKYIGEERKWVEMVDPNLSTTCHFEELRCVINIIRMCTQREGKARPPIKEVLHLLCNKLDVASPEARTRLAN